MGPRGRHIVIAIAVLAVAAMIPATTIGEPAHGDPIAPVIFGVTSILFFAILGRIAARRLNQPTVLGELLMGILLGNVAWYLGVDLVVLLREGPQIFELAHQCLAGLSILPQATDFFGEETAQSIERILSGPHGGQMMQVAHTVDVFSRYGVIFLLFMVGLDTNLDELREVGGESFRVAVLGVAAPFLLGFTAARLLMPELSLTVDMFIAATLGATSVGITATVLQEMGRHQSREGHIILGAAIFDDILGLIFLAIVTGIVVSGSVDVFDTLKVVVLACAFLFGAFKLGPWIVQGAARLLRRMDIVEAKMFTSFVFVMVLAWVANLAGLATIIGAFAAGIILSDAFFREHEEGDTRHLSIRELIMPLEVILVPIFFVLMGMQVKLEKFLSWKVLAIAGGLLLAAIIGKLIAGLGVGKDASRLVVGIGMMPRGEVGLVFAAIGRSLGVISDTLFSAIVLMVMVTTLIAPPLLKLTLARQSPSEGD